MSRLQGLLVAPRRNVNTGATLRRRSQVTTVEEEAGARSRAVVCTCARAPTQKRALE